MVLAISQSLDTAPSSRDECIRNSKIKAILLATVLVLGLLTLITGIILSVLLGSYALGLGIIFIGLFLVFLGAYFLFDYLKKKEIQVVIREQEESAQEKLRTNMTELNQRIKEIDDKCKEMEIILKQKEQTIGELTKNLNIQQLANKTTIEEACSMDPANS